MDAADRTRRPRPGAVEYRGEAGLAALVASHPGCSVTATSPRTFRAAVTATRLVDVTVRSQRSTPHRAAWVGAAPHDADAEVLICVATIAGSLGGHHDGRVIAQRPGTIALLRRARSMHYVASAPSHLVFAGLDLRLLDPTVARGLRRLGTIGFGPTAITVALTSVLDSVARHSPEPGSTAARHLERALIALIDALVFETIELEAGRARPGTALLSDVVDAVDTIVRDERSAPIAELSISGVARELGVPESEVERALRMHATSFASVVRERRVEMLADALRNENDRRSLARIAVDVGFGGSDVAGRVFRQSYGMTMGDYRTLLRV